MSPLVEICELVVRRGGRKALEVSALEVKKGEVLALVGPNGAGKSTLLLTLARLIEAEAGEIRFADRRLVDWNPLEYRRRLSFVFQAPLLLDLSVAQNVALGLGFRGVHKEHAAVMTRRWLELLDIGSLAERRAGALSGGEAQRVSLARALVLEPELLLLDEPFAALDPPTRAHLLDDVSPLLSQDHRTSVLVTHDLQEAARLADRVGVIVGGRLRQVGSVQEVKAQPVDEEVEGFLRTMNLVG